MSFFSAITSALEGTKSQNETDLIVPSEDMTFAAGIDNGEEELRQYVAQKKDTQLVPLHSKNQVLLQGDGTLFKGCRLTETALYQLCKRLLPGLYVTIRQLLSGREDQSTAAASSRADIAIRWLNELIDLEFTNRLFSWQLVVDPTSKLVEGIVSNGYQLFTNAQWLDSCDQLMAQVPWDYEFALARIYGKRMFIRYNECEPVVSDPEIFCRGYQFANSEVGDSSMSMTQALVRHKTKAAAVANVDTQARRVHRGQSNIESSIESLFRLRFGDGLKSEEFQGHLHRLQDLKFTIPADRDKQAQWIVQARRKLKQGWGASDRNILGSLVQAIIHGDGAEASRTSMFSIPGEAKPLQRSEYDVFLCLIEMANEVPFKEQIGMEQFAFRFLTRQIKLFW